MTHTIPFPRLMAWHLAALIYSLAVCLYGSQVWAAFERVESRQQYQVGSSLPHPSHGFSNAGEVKPSHLENSRPSSIELTPRGSLPFAASAGGYSQGLNVGTRAVKSGKRYSDASSILAASTIHGGALVSTGSARPMESAEVASRTKGQNQKRQLSVEAGGLTASRGNVGSASSPNGSLNLEPFAESPWERWNVSAYAHTCILPRVGPEGPPRLTASGLEAVPNWSIAAPPEYQFGTVFQLSTEGIVTSRVVHDRGHAFEAGSRKLDLFMRDCRSARRWGRRQIWARVVRVPLGGTND